ncbi:MAG: hypothetical protein NWF09_09305 [Candidatus Bathyarchaeota archaeon]|nr:hypothetical protein [Candidatus Bathyarchaeota archaeon]
MGENSDIKTELPWEEAGTEDDFLYIDLSEEEKKEYEQKVKKLLRVNDITVFMSNRYVCRDHREPAIKVMKNGVMVCPVCEFEPKLSEVDRKINMLEHKLFVLSAPGLYHFKNMRPEEIVWTYKRKHEFDEWKFFLGNDMALAVMQGDVKRQEQLAKAARILHERMGSRWMHKWEDTKQFIEKLQNINESINFIGEGRAAYFVEQLNKMGLTKKDIDAELRYACSLSFEAYNKWWTNEYWIGAFCCLLTGTALDKYQGKTESVYATNPFYFVRLKQDLIAGRRLKYNYRVVAITDFLDTTNIKLKYKDWHTAVRAMRYALGALFGHKHDQLMQNMDDKEFFKRLNDAEAEKIFSLKVNDKEIAEKAYKITIERLRKDTGIPFPLNGTEDYFIEK